MSNNAKFKKKDVKASRNQSGNSKMSCPDIMFVSRMHFFEEFEKYKDSDYPKTLFFPFPLWTLQTYQKVPSDALGEIEITTKNYALIQSDDDLEALVDEFRILPKYLGIYVDDEVIVYFQEEVNDIEKALNGI